MLQPKRSFNSNSVTNDMVNRLPEWMKMRNKDSVGYRFLNAVFGTELDLLARNLQQYSATTNIVDCPVTELSTVYEVSLDYPFASGHILPSDGNYRIFAVDDEISFLSNPPTRLVESTIIYPSGLSGDLTGIEWLNGVPSGILAVQHDTDPINPSSTLYYNTLSVDNSITLIPFSGDSFGRAYVGLGQNSGYDLLSPEPEWSLRNKYPSGVWLTPTGDILGSTTVLPTGFVEIPNRFANYIDSEGKKKYFYKPYNNPYGSGKYVLGDADLTFNPISGTLKIYDIQNLNSSGNPYEIPSSGINIYHYASGLSDGIWEYKGYDTPIPYTKLPQEIIENVRIANGGTFVDITPSSIGTVSWSLLPSGGYVDDEVYPHGGTFNWINGSGGLSKTVRFSGGISKYQAEYEYRVYENIQQLSAEPRDTLSSTASKGGAIFFVDGTSYSNELLLQPSESDPLAMRISPYIIRPNSVINVKLTYTNRKHETWRDAQTTDKTVQLLRHNIGFTDDFGSY